MKRGQQTLFVIVLAISIALILFTFKEVEYIRNTIGTTTEKVNLPQQISRDNENFPTHQFDHENPFGESWCPSAKCYNSPLCLPCNRRFLFILATGRSGSTTLLKMFDLLPNVRLSGENHNVLFQASELLRTIEDHPQNFINNETIREGFFMSETIQEGAFKHNAIPIGSFSCVVQHLFRTLNPPSITINKNSDDQLSSWKAYIDDEENEDKKILGMKGIRLQEHELLSWTPAEAATFLQENFPCSRYIININSKYRSQSKAMAKYLKAKTKGLDRSQLREKLKGENDFLTKLATMLGNETARLLDSVKWQKDVTILNDVVHWLGFQDCHFDKLAHDNRNGFSIDHSTISIGENCTYPHV